MSDNTTDSPGSNRTEHVFPEDDGPFVYSEEDIEQARALPADACPRRYCFHWDSPSFHWERSPKEGCLFLVGEKPSRKYRGIPCCRNDPSPVVDQFDTNELYADADSVDLTKWAEKWLENRRKVDELEKRLGVDDLGGYLREEGKIEE